MALRRRLLLSLASAWPSWRGASARWNARTRTCAMKIGVIKEQSGVASGAKTLSHVRRGAQRVRRRAKEGRASTGPGKRATKAARRGKSSSRADGSTAAHGWPWCCVARIGTSSRAAACRASRHLHHCGFAHAQRLGPARLARNPLTELKRALIVFCRRSLVADGSAAGTDARFGAVVAVLVGDVGAGGSHFHRLQVGDPRPGARGRIMADDQMACTCLSLSLAWHGCAGLSVRKSVNGATGT